jgi:hypothetical protein
VQVQQLEQQDQLAAIQYFQALHPTAVVVVVRTIPQIQLQVEAAVAAAEYLQALLEQVGKALQVVMETTTILIAAAVAAAREQLEQLAFLLVLAVQALLHLLLELQLRAAVAVAVAFIETA